MGLALERKPPLLLTAYLFGYESVGVLEVPGVNGPQVLGENAHGLLVVCLMQSFREHIGRGQNEQ